MHVPWGAVRGNSSPLAGLDSTRTEAGGGGGLFKVQTRRGRECLGWGGIKEAHRTTTRHKDSTCERTDPAITNTRPQQHQARSGKTPAVSEICFKGGEGEGRELGGCVQASSRGRDLFCPPKMVEFREVEAGYMITSELYLLLVLLVDSVPYTSASVLWHTESSVVDVASQDQDHLPSLRSFETKLKHRKTSLHLPMCGRLRCNTILAVRALFCRQLF